MSIFLPIWGGCWSQAAGQQPQETLLKQVARVPPHLTKTRVKGYLPSGKGLPGAWSSPSSISVSKPPSVK